MEREQVSRLIFIAAMLALVLSACGANAAPTVDPVQIQASAIAMVNTLAAQTQEAIPPTPLPTNTSLPSATPLPSPTSSPLPTLATGMSAPTQSGNDPCRGPLNAKAGNNDAGKTSKGTNISIVNNTKASITISLYLVKNVYGQCGYVSYVIARSNSILLANVLPNGCYYAHAFIDDPKKPAQVSSGPDCLTGSDKTTFTVTEDRLKVVGP